MSANVAIGVQDFSTLIENHYFYVDKTAFLKEWWDSGDSVTLITRIETGINYDSKELKKDDYKKHSCKIERITMS